MTWQKTKSEQGPEVTLSTSTRVTVNWFQGQGLLGECLKLSFEQEGETVRPRAGNQGLMLTSNKQQLLYLSFGGFSLSRGRFFRSKLVGRHIQKWDVKPEIVEGSGGGVQTDEGYCHWGQMEILSLKPKCPTGGVRCCRYWSMRKELEFRWTFRAVKGAVCRTSSENESNLQQK